MYKHNPTNGSYVANKDYFTLNNIMVWVLPFMLMRFVIKQCLR